MIPDLWLRKHALLVWITPSPNRANVTGLRNPDQLVCLHLVDEATVSVGSALFVMLTLQAGVDFNATNALSRTVQGITTGVGFIGAGLIFHQAHDQGPNYQVKGLTSAAALWLTASLGTAAGCGLWQTALIETLLSLFILSGVKRVKNAPVYSRLVRKKDSTAWLITALSASHETPR